MIPRLLFLLCAIQWCSSIYLRYDYKNFDEINEDFEVTLYEDIDVIYNVKPPDVTSIGGAFLLGVLEYKELGKAECSPDTPAVKIIISYWCDSRKSNIDITPSCCNYDTTALCYDKHQGWFTQTLDYVCEEYISASQIQIRGNSLFNNAAVGIDYIEIYTHDSTKPPESTTTAITTITTSTPETTTTTPETTTTTPELTTTTPESTTNTPETTITTTETTTTTPETTTTTPETTTTTPETTTTTPETTTDTTDMESTTTTTTISTDPPTPGRTSVGSCGESVCIFGLTRTTFIVVILSSSLSLLLLLIIIIVIFFKRHRRIYVKVVPNTIPFYREEVLPNLGASSRTLSGRRRSHGGGHSTHSTRNHHHSHHHHHQS